MPEIITQKEFDDEWLKLFYEQVGREVTLARESLSQTHNWVITLFGAVITASLAFGGRNATLMTEKTFIIILAITPLFFRFFVRSCLEYQTYHRWVTFRDALDKYFYFKDNNEEYKKSILLFLKENIPTYYFSWKAPRSFLKMIKDNILLAYGWLLIVLLLLLVWGTSVLPMTTTIRIMLIVFIPWMFFELLSFYNYRGFKYHEPVNNIQKIGQI